VNDNDIASAVRLVVGTDHHAPFDVLGPHIVETEAGRQLVIRCYEPGAQELHCIEKGNSGRTLPMQERYAPNFFECTFEGHAEPVPYELRAVYQDGQQRTFRDPYAFRPQLSDYDLHLLAEGNLFQAYERLGAHLATVDGVSGVRFAVWAPNARRVSVVGDFNDWDGRRHQMRTLGGSGVWEIFVPGIGAGRLYKYEIKTGIGHVYHKADPYAFACELRPRTASIVTDLEKYAWHDQEWMSRRAESNVLHQPVSIYEVHLGSWMRVPEENNRFLTYRELADKLALYVQAHGFTHIELLPVSEHPFDGSWGYQVLGYYAATSRFGTPDDFKYFVDTMHQHGIGVIMDWVPAHFPRDDYGLSYFDGTFLYEHSDPHKREHKDWGTLIFNYGRNEVRAFLISNALFWFDKYHLDGLRVDAVASMLYLDYSRKEGEWAPNFYGGREALEAIHFLKRLNEVVFERYPSVMMIAEESTAWPGVSKPTYLGGLGFNLKWNMGWMNDFLTYMSKEPIHRKYHQDMITFALLYAFHENFVLVLSHDEVTHGKRSLLNKMTGDMWQKFANLRALIAFMYGHPGKKLLFMGTEIGQWNEWNSNQSLDWHLLQHEPHQKLSAFLSDLNRIYRDHAALWDQDFNWEGFEWIDFHDRDNSVISFLRWSRERKQCLLFVCNFTPVPRGRYRIGAPYAGRYRFLMDSDSGAYWGSNHVGHDDLVAGPTPWQGKPFSFEMTLPPLSTVILEPLDAPAPEPEPVAALAEPEQGTPA
jgi:1,4-alpha-glucan branching enzyme